jgi:hypothetical protein
VSRTEDDGGRWSVECDWFAGSGLVFDLYTVADAEEIPGLKVCFADVPVFLQAIKALETIAKGKDEKAVQCTKHKKEYLKNLSKEDPEETDQMEYYQWLVNLADQK